MVQVLLPHEGWCLPHTWRGCEVPETWCSSRWGKSKHTLLKTDLRNTEHKNTALIKCALLSILCCFEASHTWPFWEKAIGTIVILSGSPLTSLFQENLFEWCILQETARLKRVYHQKIYKYLWSLTTSNKMWVILSIFHVQGSSSQKGSETSWEIFSLPLHMSKMNNGIGKYCWTLLA